MMVRQKKAPPARKMPGGQPTPKTLAQSYTFPAPIRGWVLDESLAGAMPGGASVLDNWICTLSGIRVRGGKARVATLPGPVVSLMSYRSTPEKRFAATVSGIFDFTSPADPDVALSPAVSGLTSGDMSALQFGTAGGDFLYAVNGSDDAQLFDGTTWAAINAVSSPAITGVLTSDLSHMWSHANRIWAVGKNTSSAWYLPVDSIAGAMVEFSLAGVFTRGGSLLFGAKWSLDAGDGLDDKCVFVSTRGEVAIYEGTNPGAASDWRLAGLYTMPRPLGKNAYIQAGGDLLVATVSGLIPISAAINTDLGAIETKAVSKPIAPYWTNRANALSAVGWEIIKVAGSGIMVVSQPDPTGSAQTCLTVNLVTGAWSRVTGWDVQCLLEYDQNGYFGSADGGIYLMDTGGNDAGDVYTATYLGLFDAMGAYGQGKTVLQMRPLFKSASPINPQVTANSDFDDSAPSPPNSAMDYAADAWDLGLWDVAVWDAAAGFTVAQSWFSTPADGTFIAPLVQMSFGVGPTPYVELAVIDAQFEIGAVVS